MKTIPIAAPSKAAPVGKATVQTSQEARERAMAKFNNPAPEAPVTPPEAPTPAVEASASTPAPDSQEGQTDKVVEAPATPASPAETPLSAQYAQLARKEKALRMQAQQLKADRDAFKAAQDANKPAPSAPEVDTSKYIPRDRLTKETLAVLAEQGISYEQLTQMALTGAPTQEAIERQTELNQLRAEIKALKDGQEKTEKNFNEAQTRSYEQAVTQIRNEAKNLVKNDPNFELVAAENATDDVVELITKTFEADGTLLTVEEAAQAVEDYLTEKAIKLSNLKKIQAKLKTAASAQAVPKPSESKTGAEAPTAPATAKTLTNALGTQRKLSSKERAILAFKGELKN